MLKIVTMRVIFVIYLSTFLTNYFITLNVAIKSCFKFKMISLENYIH